VYFKSLTATCNGAMAGWGMARGAIDPCGTSGPGVTAGAGDHARQVHRRRAQRVDVALGDGEQRVIEGCGAAARVAGETTGGIRGRYGDLDRCVTGNDAIDWLGMAAAAGALPEVLRPGFCRSSPWRGR